MPSFASTEQTPAPAAQRFRAFGLVALATIGMAGSMLTPGLMGTAQAATAPPQTSISRTISQPSTQSVRFALSDPARPLPGNANVDTSTWIHNTQEVFGAKKAGDTEKLLGLMSPGGIWIRGLEGAPSTSTGMVHMTHDEMARDLREHGPFHDQVLARSSNARFVVTPDSQGLVQTILLD